MNKIKFGMVGLLMALSTIVCAENHPNGVDKTSENITPMVRGASEANIILTERKQPQLRIAAIKTLDKHGWKDNQRALAALIFAREEGSSAVRALTTKQMKTPESFAHVWDFKNVWMMNKRAYPTLRKHPAAKTSRGTGTKNDPYLIATAKQLDNVRHLLGPEKHFRQVADIDLKGYGDPKKGWLPISHQKKAGTIGSYHGGGYTISNLYINRPNMNNVGLFGSLSWPDSPGKLSHIALKHVNITGRKGVGALGGHLGTPIKKGAKKTVVENCYVTGKVSGQDISGGLAGLIWACEVKNVYVAVSLNPQGRNVSPFVDRLWWGSNAQNCFYDGDVANVENVAIAALKTLRKHNPELNTSATLFTLLRSEDAFVRSEAGKFLSALNPDSQMTISGLLPAFKDDRYDVRRHARQVVQQYGAKAQEQIAQALANAYEKAKSNPAERRRLVRGSGEIANTLSISFLINALDDGDVNVRQNGINALNWMEIPYIDRYMPLGINSHWWAKRPEQHQVVAALQKIVENDTDAQVKTKAKVAVARISGKAVEPETTFWRPPLSQKEERAKNVYDRVDLQREFEIENYAKGVTWPFKKIFHASAQLYLNRNLELANRLLMAHTDLAPYGSEAGGLGAPFWSAVYGLYNSRSTHLPGRLSPETENLFKERMFTFVSWISAKHFDDYIGDVWKLSGTENHHLTFGPTTWYLYLGYLKQDPKYANRKLHGDKTITQWCDLWAGYWREWLKARALKGLWVEMGSHTYQKYSYPAIFALTIGAEDAIVRKRAKMFMDLSLIEEASLSFNYIRGGGKSRASMHVGGGIEHVIPALHGEKRDHKAWHLGQHVPVISGYRAPLEAILIRQKYHHREKPIIISNRRPGETGSNQGLVADSAIINYCYKTRHYMLGSSLRPPQIETSALFGQTMWNGLIFANGDGVFPNPVHSGGGRFVDPYYSFQHENVMIFQMNKGAYATKSVRLYVKPETKKVEKNGWVFVNDGAAYCAIKVLDGGYKWDKENLNIAPDKILSPVLIQGGDVDTYGSFKAFMVAVQGNTLTSDGEKVRYQGAKQGRIEFFSRPTGKLPRINGHAYNFRPKKVYSSPYMNSTGDATVTVTVGALTTIYDFKESSVTTLNK